MTLATIRSEVQYRSGDNTLSETNIDRWVNLAIKQWAAREDWPSTTETNSSNTTTASTAEYNLPSDFKKMIGVRVGTASTTTEPNSTDYSFVDYKNKNVSTEGTYYYLNPDAGTFGLIPTPATTGLPIYLKYFKIPADLTLSTEEPPFDGNYNELVIFFALKKYAESIDEFDKALYYNAEFENMIEQMKSALFTRATGQLTRMKDFRELVRDNQPQKLNSVEIGQ